MANWDNLKSAIQDVIKENGNEEITGQVLQNTLLSIVNNIGENATFAGIATPETNPGTPDANVFWLAAKEGEYPNFNGYSVGREVVFFVNDSGQWQKVETGIAMSDMVNNIAVETAFEVGQNLKDFEVVGYYSSATGAFVPSVKDRSVLVPFINKNFRLYLTNITSFNPGNAVVILRDYSLKENKKIIFKNQLSLLSENNYYVDVEVESPCSLIIQYGSGNSADMELRVSEYKKNAYIPEKVDAITGGNLTKYVKNGYYSSATGAFVPSVKDRSILITYIDSPVRVNFYNLVDKSGNGISLMLRYPQSNIRFASVLNSDLINDGDNNYHYDVPYYGTIALVIMYGVNNSDDLYISLENLNSQQIVDNATYMTIKNDIIVSNLTIGNVLDGCSVAKNGNGIKITISSDVTRHNNIFTVNLSEIDEVNIGDVLYIYTKYNSTTETAFYGMLGTATVPMVIKKGSNLVSKNYFSVSSNYANTERNLMRLNADVSSGEVDFQSIVKINLTKMYGSGNEPTQEEFEHLLDILEDKYNISIEDITVKEFIEYLNKELNDAKRVISSQETDLVNVLDATNLLGMAKKWELISPYFKPTEEYTDVFGDYSDPLKFYNGQSVTTPQEWEVRKAEIKAKWTSIMGEWPDLNTTQTFNILESEKKCGYTKHTVSFEWITGHTTTGYLLVPDNDVLGRNEENLRPAIITVSYGAVTAIGESDNPKYYTMDYALQAVRRGYIALSIGENPARSSTSSFFYPSKDESTIQPLSVMAYCAANAYYVLSNYEGVNKDKIGITGLSYGGKWALFASCLFDKFACGVWGDAGVVFDRRDRNINYWDDWYLGHPTIDFPNGAYQEFERQQLQLTELMALMAPRPFLVSGGVQDKVVRWTALNYEINVNNVLGNENAVAMTNRKTHISDDESNRQMFWFFDHFLKPDHEIDH
jgi:hypothetical protein